MFLCVEVGKDKEKEKLLHIKVTYAVGKKKWKLRSHQNTQHFTIISKTLI